MRVRLRSEVEDSWLDHSVVYTVLCLYSLPNGPAFRLLGAAEPTTPAIHPACYFDVVDPTVSPRWVCEIAADGQSVNLEPAAWTSEGFWERYFEGDPVATRIFRYELRLLLHQG